MIVYGDPSYEAELGGLVARLQARLAELCDAPGKATRDALRSLLIEAGQLEQAAQDASADSAGGALLQGVTDRLASAFHTEWAASSSALCRDDVLVALRNALDALNDLTLPDMRVTAKLPEGYSFYALYPEQYAAAARRWVADHADDAAGTVLVVGVRSIGTSLSALVGAALEAEGRRARRLTVRPSGHPYERRVEPPASAGAAAAWGLVVDEGPGQSGSSMAAVAEMLVSAGVDRSRICFFPGHAGGPGPAASDAVRAWWARAPRYVAAPGDLRFVGRSLTGTLALLTQGVRGGPVVRVEDLSGGLWRRRCYRGPAEWPASCLPFERPKFLCVLADGSAVLWKFEGLAVGPDGPLAEAAFRRQAERARQGWTVAPLALGSGFVAVPWVEGQPLSLEDARNQTVLAHIGRYAASVAGPPLAEEERLQAVRRTGEMLYWNVWEALGEEWALRTRRWSDISQAWAREHDSATYGDGRLAPHEWVRMADGRLVKTDGGGHDADHTMVGRQSALWDVAGAMVEWGLDADTARPLLQAFEAVGGVPAPDDVLTFYRLAYAAFRLGQCAMSADVSAHDPEEQARLWGAAERYGAEGARLLGR